MSLSGPVYVCIIAGAWFFWYCVGGGGNTPWDLAGWGATVYKLSSLLPWDYSPRPSRHLEMEIEHVGLERNLVKWSLWDEKQWPHSYWCCPVERLYHGCPLLVPVCIHVSEGCMKGVCSLVSLTPYVKKVVFFSSWALWDAPLSSNCKKWHIWLDLLDL